MKKGGSKLFLFAGVGLALVAVALLVTSMSGGGKADAQKDAKAAKTTIVQAAVDVSAHTLLTPEVLIEVQVPETQVTTDSVRTKAEVIGRAYRVPLVKGQPLLMSQTELPGLRNEIETGKRAVAVAVDVKSLLSGLVQDGDFVDIVFHARIDVVRILPTNLAAAPEDAAQYKMSGGVFFLPPDLEAPEHPAVGDPGSKMFIRDQGLQLEPVAKIMLQDIKVLRVVRPGQSYASTGALSETGAPDGETAVPSEDGLGHLILQVSPKQAEMVTFMQDERHAYQVLVRGKDDHETVTTSGVTFQILATDAEWSLPWPKSLTTPKEQTTSTGADGDPDSGDDDEPATQEEIESRGAGVSTPDDEGDESSSGS